jgi:hypothetical protein
METYIMFVGGTVEVKSTRRFANHDSLQLPCHLTSYYYTDNMLHSLPSSSRLVSTRCLKVGDEDVTDE